MRFIENSLNEELRTILPIIQNRIKNNSTYFGIKTLKNPFDNWVIQELLFANRPDVIIEIGNLFGGSTFNLAHFCDQLGKGRVIGIDISQLRIPDTVLSHPRITFIEGDACDKFEEVKKLISISERVMVIEDSSHTYQNTLDILNLYSTLLSVGDYIIIEDSICHHGLNEGPSPGPYEAIEKFLLTNTDFYSDRRLESFLITWNPKGFITRINESDKKDGNAIKKTNSLKKFLPRIWRLFQLFIPPIVGIAMNKMRSAYLEFRNKLWKK